MGGILRYDWQLEPIALASREGARPSRRLQQDEGANRPASRRLGCPMNRTPESNLFVKVHIRYIAIVNVCTAFSNSVFDEVVFTIT